MSDHHVERVRNAMLPLCEPLDDAFTWAEQARRARWGELAIDRTYGWLATHMVRAFAHHRLSRLSKDDLGGWRLSGDHSRNGALWMTDGDYRIRVLHATSVDDVPPPGHNRTRKAFYRNPPLVEQQLPLFGDEHSDRLLILWRIDPAMESPCFRVVRPIGTWRYGSTAQTDLDFILPATADQLADLTFEPSDEGLPLEVPNEEGQDGDASGLSG